MEVLDIYEIYLRCGAINDENLILYNQMEAYYLTNHPPILFCCINFHP